MGEKKNMLESSDKDPHLQQKLIRHRTFFFCRQIKAKKFGGELSDIGVTFGRTTIARVPPKTLLTVALVQKYAVPILRSIGRLLYKSKYPIPPGSLTL